MLTYADEFHHAVTDHCRRIVDYFKPEFLLGLTAMLERMVGRSIYEICDYNVPYEISLKETINKGILVPFRYYGIFDDTDYSYGCGRLPEGDQQVEYQSLQALSGISARSK